MNAILQTAAGNPENQDRAAIVECSAGLVLVVADGAGGSSGGTEAAALAVEIVRQRAHGLSGSDACVTLLEFMDQTLWGDVAAGEATCVLAVGAEDRVYGASVGDSGVWVITQTGFVDLTRGQSRKPLIGSGSATPLPFEFGAMGGARLLLATDGLLKYASPERIAATCRTPDLSESARQLIELVRYPSGDLPDDVTVILASTSS
jgi:serine/threonine protein phosphatase PrpC